MANDLSFMKGKPFVSKVAVLAKYFVLPSIMVFAAQARHASNNKDAPATSN